MLYKNCIWVLVINILLLFIKCTKQHGIKNNVLNKELTADIILLKNCVENLQLDVDKLHSGLNSQTDIIYEIRTNIFSNETSLKQCKTNDEFFQDIDTKLMITKQSLQKILKKNDSQHKNKMYLILQNIQNSGDCNANNEKVVGEIKNEILERLAEFDKYMERLQILEQKLNIYLKPEVEIENPSLEKSPDLETILNEINLKLNSQEKRLLNFEQQLPLIQTISTSVKDYLSAKTDKSKCSKGRCVLYRIFGMDKALNATSVKP